MAVRDRRSGKWYRWHGALRGTLVGAVDRRRATRRGRLGARLCFRGPQLVMTSTVLEIERPPKVAVEYYVNLCWSGSIAG